MRMYAALSSRRGCSQVLFLGVLRPHNYDQLEVATWVGATCLTAVGRASSAKVVALRLHRRKSDGPMNTLNIFRVYTGRFSQH